MATLHASISAGPRRGDASDDGLAAASAAQPQRQPGAACCDSPAQRHGPGWFESSWDLQRGLDVREGLPADCRWEEWVEAWLRS